MKEKQSKMAISNMRPSTLFLVGSVVLAAATGYFFHNKIAPPFNNQSSQPKTALVQREESPYESNFPESKILTISARDYVESRSKKLQDYDTFGLCGASERETSAIAMPSHYIGYKAPKGTEAIVDFKPSGHASYFSVGTALVPREKIK